MQQRAAAAGAPVPHILAADNSPAALGNPYLICDAIAGETIVRRIQRALDDAGRARLLRTVRAGAGRDPPGRSDGHRAANRSTSSPSGAHRLDEMGDTTATFEWAFRWLADNRPAPSPTRLVHGDFRMGNLIVDDSGLAAVLDWELTHIGEVYEDLAWFCIRAWRFGAPETLGAGGLGSVEDFLSAYEQAGGNGRRPRRVPLVADGGHAALGRHLPLPGRAPSVRADAVGRARRDRPAGQRNRMGRAGSTGRRRR